MTKTNDLVAGEIEDHRIAAEELISSINAITIPTSRKGTAERFVRDWRNLIADLDSGEPSSHDLTDFTDRRASLEIQFLNFTSDLG